MRRRRGSRVALGLTRRSIKAWNGLANVGMLGINERLGFVRKPAWILAAKHDVMHDA